MNTSSCPDSEKGREQAFHTTTVILLKEMHFIIFKCLIRLQ
jgi:hypothetical protein